MQGIKKFIQDILYKRCIRDYRKMTYIQMDPYRQWYMENEGWKKESFSVSEGEFVIFHDKRGRLEDKAGEVFASIFSKHPEVMLIYADEDEIDSEGKRKSPWFKPVFSPDALASFNIYGHIYAVRSKCLEGIPEGEWKACLDNAGSKEAYGLALKITKDILKLHTPSPLDENPAIVPAPGKVLIHMPENTKDQEGDYERNIKYLFGIEDHKTPGVDSISIVIPSKDNPKVLKTCITSVLGTLTDDKRPEIIVVDNGSSPDNKAIIDDMAAEYGFTYIYEPAPFNFSAMCNMGIKRSKGSYILFLNDDIEAIEKGWLEKLLFCASLPHVGGAGVKLLYPGTDLIQHAGVTNIKAGPVHKLQKMHDREYHYHGQNLHVYDMVGVTAACMLIAKEKIERCGGIREDIKVSYNDVELCFSLLEQGLYNVYMGNIKLYHHESLSRGDDNLSDEKWERLLHEKDHIYELHPEFKSFDPFYSPYLATHSNIYIEDVVFDFDKHNYLTGIKAYSGKDPDQWKNEALIINVEHCRWERRYEINERDDIYWIEGWSYVLGNDNARYKRNLVLVSPTGKLYILGILDRYRKDVAKVLSEQENVELAGFTCRIPYSILTEKEYRVGMIAADRCSTQKLYALSDKVMVIEQNQIF